jgi:hypothetical protein
LHAESTPAPRTTASRLIDNDPHEEGGKPVDGYARVPVKFDLTPLADGANRN